MFKKNEPFLLVDEAKAENNLDRIYSKVKKSNAEFRPHFKTHQSLHFGKMFQDKGINSITVSSMGMAEYFAGAYKDITIAFPFNILQLERLNKTLEKQFVNIMVDSPELVNQLLGKINHPCGVWIEIETGNKRTGIDPTRIDDIKQMLSKIESDPHLSAKGLYSHPGHSYTKHGETEVLKVFNETKRIINEVKSNLGSEGAKLLVNVGDTPSSSFAPSFDNVDSVSCGNFVFYDMMQVHIGSCKVEDVAVCLAVPVVSVNKERKEIAVLAGGIHLSKEKMEIDGKPYFGSVVLLNENGWSNPLEDCTLRSISQEHGVISASEELIDKVQLGDFLGILPVHSCMTAECMGEYYNLKGEKIDHFASKKRS